jgi:hypothetical protein
MRKVIPGIRYFKCETCGCEWNEGCRDAATQSMSDCPECHTVASPDMWEEDPLVVPPYAIDITKNGNII